MIVRRAWALVVSGTLVAGGILVGSVRHGGTAQHIAAGVIVVAALVGVGLAWSLHRDMARTEQRHQPPP